jgi:hypothetical protein
MLFAKRLKGFSRALSGIIYQDDYLSYITDGEMTSYMPVKYKTPADSKKEIQQDFYFLSLDFKQAVKQAKAR